MTDTDLIAQAEASDKRLHFTEVRQDAVRWEPYKPDGRRQMKARGRWQRRDGYGDFWRWTNCDRPGDLHHEDYDYRDALAAALTRADEWEAACHAAQAKAFAAIDKRNEMMDAMEGYRDAANLAKEAAQNAIAERAAALTRQAETEDALAAAASERDRLRVALVAVDCKLIEHGYYETGLMRRTIRAALYGETQR